MGELRGDHGHQWGVWMLWTEGIMWVKPASNTELNSGPHPSEEGEKVLYKSRIPGYQASVWLTICLCVAEW